MLAQVPDLGGRRGIAREKVLGKRTARPTLKECTLRTPPLEVPSTISVEPPPTSTTPTSPFTTCPRVLVAPMNASRPSSWPRSTSTGTPHARSIASTTSSRFEASRIAAVATMRIAAASSSSASLTWVATAPAISAIFSGSIVPSARDAFPSWVYARWSITLRSWPFSGSATSTRVVFEPMSIAAQSIAGIVPEGADVPCPAIHRDKPEEVAVAKTNRDEDLFGMMRAAGVRKKVAMEVSDAVGGIRPGGKCRRWPARRCATSAPSPPGSRTASAPARPSALRRLRSERDLASARPRLSARKARARQKRRLRRRLVRSIGRHARRSAEAIGCRRSLSGSEAESRQGWPSRHTPAPDGLCTVARSPPPAEGDGYAHA